MNRNIFKIDGKKTVFYMLLYSWFASLFMKDNAISKLGYDVFLAFILYLIFKKKKNLRIKSRLKKTGILPLVIGWAYILTCVVSAVINSAPILQVWWNARTSFAMIIYWVGCVYFLDDKDVSFFNDFVLKLAHVNFFACIIELFLLGISQDLMGGVFGSYVGVNGILNIYMMLITILAFNRFFEKKISVLNFGLIVVENLLIAAFAELKIYYVDIALIFALVVILNKPSFKTVFIIMAAAVVAPMAISLFAKYNPYFADFFSLEKILENYEYAYSSYGGLSRGRAWKYIVDKFLTNNTKLMLGIGFGNATFSEVSFLKSEFYNTYKSLRYSFFAHSYKLLETGYLGAITYILFWIAPFLNVQVKASNESKNLARIFSLMCILLFVYNNSLMNSNTMFSVVFIISEISIEKDIV